MLQKYTHTRYIANLIYINSIINLDHVRACLKMVEIKF